MTEIAGLSLVNDVRIQEGDGEFFGTKSYSFDVPAGDTDTVTIFEFSEPIPISILAAQIVGNPAYAGDTMEFLIAPDTTVGALTADAAIDDTILHVSPTVLENVRVGFWLKLVDGAQSQDCGRILTVDVETGTLTIETALTMAFVVATPTYVQMTIKMVPHGHLPSLSRIMLGDSKIGGTLLAANTTLKVIYTNHDGLAKTFEFWLEYMY